MGCSIKSASGTYQALGFSLENSGLQEGFYGISADVPILGIEEVPSDFPLIDENIKKYQLLSNTKLNLLEADTSRIDRTTFKTLGKEPHDSYTLFLGYDRNIVIMDALARIVPNNIFAHPNPTFWELFVLLFLLIVLTGKSH